MVPELPRGKAPSAIPAFRALWLGGLLSEAGDWLLHIAVPLVVLELSGSPAVTALSFVLGLAPGAVLGPLAGTLVERFDRTRVLIVVSLGQAVLLLPLLAVHDKTDLWLLYLVTAGESALAAVFEPTKCALLPDLVAPSRLVAANGLLGLNADIGRLAGGPLGGVVLQLAGLRGVMLADVASFIAVALLLAIWVPASHGRGSGGRLVADFRSGICAIKASTSLRGLLGGYVLMSAAQGMFLLLFVLFVTRVLHGGEATTGILRGVQALGGLLGGLLIGTVAGRLLPRTLAGWGLIGVGLLSIATWNAPLLSTALGLYVVGYILVGVPSAAAVSGLLAGVQASADEQARVRILATVFAIGDAAQMVATLAVGWLLAAVPLMVLLNVQAALHLGGGVLILLGLTRRDGANTAQPGELSHPR